MRCCRIWSHFGLTAADQCDCDLSYTTLLFSCHVHVSGQSSPRCSMLIGRPLDPGRAASSSACTPALAEQTLHIHEVCNMAGRLSLWACVLSRNSLLRAWLNKRAMANSGAGNASLSSCSSSSTPHSSWTSVRRLHVSRRQALCAQFALRVTEARADRC